MLAEVGLLLTVLANVVVLWALNGRRVLLGHVIAYDATVSHADAAHSDDRVRIAAVVLVVASIGAAVTLTMWFWPLRRNAGVFSPDRQRRSQAWAFWGWICPIVSLWFPLQIAIDAWRSTPGHKFGGTRLLGWWWASYLLSVVVWRVSTTGGHDAEGLRPNTDFEMARAIIEIIAAVLAILVVRRLTASDDEYRAALSKQLPRQPAGWPAGLPPVYPGQPPTYPPS